MERGLRSSMILKPKKPSRWSSCLLLTLIRNTVRHSWRLAQITFLKRLKIFRKWTICWFKEQINWFMSHISKRKKDTREVANKIVFIAWYTSYPLNGQGNINCTCWNATLKCNQVSIQPLMRFGGGETSLESGTYPSIKRGNGTYIATFFTVTIISLLRFLHG